MAEEAVAEEAEAEESQTREEESGGPKENGLMAQAKNGANEQDDNGEQAKEETTNKEEPETEESSEDSDGEEPSVYEPSGELTEDQVDSLPDHMINDDGTVDAEQLVKQNMGFRDKQSDGTLEEAIEFYENNKEKIEDGELKEENEEKEPKNEAPESPEDYEVMLENEEGEKVEVDEEMSEILRDAGYKAGLSEEQLNEFVNSWQHNFNENFTREIDPDEELAKLSDDPQEAQKMVNEVNQQITGMYERGYLTEDEYNEGIIMGGTAEGVSLIRKLMERTEKVENIPSDTSSVGGESVQDVQDEIEELMNHEAYFDPSHEEHQKVNRKAEELREKKREMGQEQ